MAHNHFGKNLVLFVFNRKSIHIYTYIKNINISGTIIRKFKTRSLLIFRFYNVKKSIHVAIASLMANAVNSDLCSHKLLLKIIFITRLFSFCQSSCYSFSIGRLDKIIIIKILEFFDYVS